MYVRYTLISVSEIPCFLRIYTQGEKEKDRESEKRKRVNV